MVETLEIQYNFIADFDPKNPMPVKNSVSIHAISLHHKNKFNLSIVANLNIDSKLKTSMYFDKNMWSRTYILNILKKYGIKRLLTKRMNYSDNIYL